jgi:hypothetical protein
MRAAEIQMSLLTVIGAICAVFLCESEMSR